MATPTTTNELSRVIANLQKQRDQHVAAITEIDAAFARFGVTASAKRGPGRPKGKGAKPKGSKKRGRFNKTADEFVLDLLKKNKTLTTREINIRWKHAGRGGSADNILMALTKGKQITRKNIKDARGSNYSLATGTGKRSKKKATTKKKARKSSAKKPASNQVPAKPKADIATA
jgi:hypothetical protein